MYWIFKAHVYMHVFHAVQQQHSHEKLPQFMVMQLFRKVLFQFKKSSFSFKAVPFVLNNLKG